MAAKADIALLARQAVSAPVYLVTMEAIAELVMPRDLLEPLEVGPTAQTIPFAWGRVPGVDKAEVPRTALTIGPPSAGHAQPGISLGTLPSRIDDGQLVVDVPGERRIRSLHLTKLATDEEKPQKLTGLASLGDRRLSISAADASGSFGAPVVCVPPAARRGQIPETLGGGSYRDGVLSLPDVAGRKLRISLVTGATPDVFERVKITAGTVTGWAAPVPRDLTVTGPDGTVLWSFPGEFLPGSAEATVDLTAGLQGAIEALLAGSGPVAGVVSITAKQPATIRVAKPAISGSFLRSIRGTTKVELAGSPVDVPIEGEPLPSIEPTSVTGDVRVMYAGIRVAEISDLLPVSRAVSGVVVGPDPIVRVFPPQALRGERIVKLGLIGRSAGGAELSVQLVDPTPPVDAPLAPPSVVKLDPAPTSAEVGVVWADLGDEVEVVGPVAVAVTATRGSFLWAADPEPSVRVAIVDPDPGGRPVILAGDTLVTLDKPELKVARAALPAAPFARSADALSLASALFCTMELTDLEIRYARPGPG